MKRVYMDNAATTALRRDVLDAMMPYLTDIYGNPSSLHYFGQEAHKAVENARHQVASALNAEDNEIVFTGCGTEADNMALKGIAEKYQSKGKHIITSSVEHHAILHTCEYLEKHGFEVTYLPVDEYGMVKAEQVRDAIRSDTILVSIMFANNEVGTIMPIKEIGAVCREKGVFFHTDAVQAVGHVAIDVKAMNIDLLSLSAHKLHGPKGVGALYIRKGIVVPPLLHGGAQERRKRAGTENVAGIVGLGKAIEIACSDIEGTSKRMCYLRDKLINGIEASIPEVKLNGHRTERLPGNVNFSIKYIEGESILLMLDINGIAASSGSACTSGSLDPSHVLLAMGMPHETAHGSLRLTLGDDTTEDDIDYVLEVLPEIVVKLRKMSPLYHG
ncbi:MAG: cysteine desulfurase NifS [Clostridiales bacterium]|nr:cysteine desulfurase NifS [Clostridiales bacterium]MDD7689202.1 cysteine desulfurase NifS [Clostridiales bacterium]MDY4621536.1 cysteine desulfurase NifS [Eubacteriales bacterium]